MKEEQISVMLPNIGNELIPVSIVKGWEFIDTNTIGETVFCKFEDYSLISMKVEDYNRLFNEKK